MNRVISQYFLSSCIRLSIYTINLWWEMGEVSLNTSVCYSAVCCQFCKPDKIHIMMSMLIVGWKPILYLLFSPKITLCRISPAKRSRSGQNSVYVDRSRGDNVQGILGAIGSFWAQWGRGRVPRSNGQFSPNWPRNVIQCLIDESWKSFSKIFTLGVICPQNLKLKVGQIGTSLRAGYRSRDALQRDTVYSAL